MDKNNPNAFTKALNAFTKSVNTILKKADMPMETPPQPNGVGDGKDALVEECMGMLDDGSLTADPEAVQMWATSKGMSEQEAADFAEAILTDYFDTEGEPGEATPKADTPPLPGMPDNDGDEGDMQKAAKALGFYIGQVDKKLASLKKMESNLEVLTKGLMTLISSNSELLETNKLMKANLEKIGLTPASKANPVTSAPAVTKGGVESIPFGKKKEIVMKGIETGKLRASATEVNLFESTYGIQLTDNIKNFIEETNKEGK